MQGEVGQKIPTKSKQVLDELDNLEKNISGLEEITGALEERLKSVVLEVPLVDPDCKPTTYPTLVQLAQRILLQRERIEGCRGRLISLCDRLEI